MYSPPDFLVTDPAEIDAMIEDARLGLLVTAGAEGLTATHLPFLYDAAARTLTGHIARANPHPAMAGDGEALVVLSGVEAYVSPRWYANGGGGRHVPTWNYEAVHLWGRIVWFEDRAALRDTVDRLTLRHEQGVVPPWTTAEAEAAYLERLLAAIVGVRFAVTRVEAKRKLSQNRDHADRIGVIAGLETAQDPRDRLVAARMRGLGLGEPR